MIKLGGVAAPKQAPSACYYTTGRAHGRTNAECLAITKGSSAANDEALTEIDIDAQID